MTSLVELWLPILVSAVFVFLASSVLHMALPWHVGDFRRLPDEDRIRDAIRGTPPGQYMMPMAESMKEMQSPEMVRKLEEGPVGTLIVRGSGMSMGPSLLKWFVYTLIVSVFCAYLTGIGNGPGAAAMTVFQYTGAIALLGHAFSHVHEWTWKGLSGTVAFKFAIDGTIYALITAATFAWLWPAAA